jgi:hypothetical protein
MFAVMLQVPRAVHVITYNTQAMALYTMQGFACVARLSRFYFISTGRQPDPNTQVRGCLVSPQLVAACCRRRL